MVYAQYQAHCEEFNVPVNIDIDSKRSIFVVGGTINETGTAIVPIALKYLELEIDILIQIINNNLQLLQNMKNMKDKRLEFGIWEEVVRFKNAEQNLAIQNHFLVHR